MSLVANKYKVTEKIGAGSFGEIYKGYNIRTNQYVAIKVEPIKNNTMLLKNESTFYQYLKDIQCIPNVKWFGKDNDNYYMVIDLLGISLQTLKEKRGKLTLKDTLHIGIHIINLLKNIHDKFLIHRDIKPDNFLFGLNNKSSQLYLIDFGFCKTYTINDKHIKMRKTSNLIGTPIYASINAHNLLEMSRRDDLESLAYMLIFFCNGKLEWQYDFCNDTIIEKKEKILVDNSLSLYPAVLIDYIKYTRLLNFEDSPDYLYLINMFKKEMEKL
jgi:casein kinase I family protein HRR25